MRRLRWLALLVTMLVVAGCSPAGVAPSGSTGAYHGVRLDSPYHLADVTLTDTAGKPFNILTSPTKPVRVLFFGYTNCPDICPGVLADVAGALNRVSDSARQNIEVVFITTDPPRDTPAAIRTYLDRFDPSFVGLTGDLPTIKRLAESVGVAIEGTEKLPSGGYEVNHTAQLVGVDRQNLGRLVWTVGTPIGNLKSDLERLVAEQ